MMSLSPFLMLTYSTMILSTLMAMSSSNWIMLWLALELNLLSFIPIMLSNNQLQETEASVKYMLTQALGSSLLLISSLFMYAQQTSTYVMTSILIMAIMIKIGMAPCHMWYPSVMSAITWNSAFILTSWQKLAPLSIMMFILVKSSQWIMMMIASLNALLGGLMGINQSQLRTILAYSSITHLGWMMSLVSINMSLMAMSYFIMYILVISPIFYMLNSMNVKTLIQMNNSMKTWSMLSIMLPLTLLSLGGLPPLLGFMPKLMTIVLLQFPTLTMILILGSLMNLYYYLNITFASMLSLSKMNMSHTDKKFSYMSMFPTISLLIFIPLIMMYALTMLNKS